MSHVKKRTPGSAVASQVALYLTDRALQVAALEEIGQDLYRLQVGPQALEEEADEQPADLQAAARAEMARPEAQGRCLPQGDFAIDDDWDSMNDYYDNILILKYPDFMLG